MQAYSVLIWLVGVLAIAASDPVAKPPLSPVFRRNWSERLQFANLSAAQADVLQSVATKAIEEAVHGILYRTRALCDELFAGGPRDDMYGTIKAEGRSMVGGGNGEPIVDRVRRILREGLPSKNITALDPFTYGHLPILPINIPDILQAELQLDNGTFEGLSDFQEDIPNPKVSIQILPPKVTVIVVFDVLEPLVQFITAYSLDAHAQDLDIWGIGNLTFKLFSLRVNGAVTVKSLITTQVDPCRINIAGRSSKVELTGLLGGGLTSDLVGEIFTDLVNENMNTLFSAVAQLVEKEMCAYFRAKDALQWVQLLRDIKVMPLPPST